VGDTTDAGSNGTCGTFNLAVNPWVGYEADAAVVAYVAEQRLGCTVNKKDLKEESPGRASAPGEVDAILRNWGHDDLKKKYITDQKTAVSAGQTGNKGVIGWYVPPWLAKALPRHHRLAEPRQVRRQVQDLRVRRQRQLLDGDPSYVTNDAALVTNLKLDFKVVYAGSETALIQAFRQPNRRSSGHRLTSTSPSGSSPRSPSSRSTSPPTPRLRRGRLKIACANPVYNLDRSSAPPSPNPAARLQPRQELQTGPTTTRTSSPNTSPSTRCPTKPPRRSGRRQPGKVDAWLK